MTVTVENWEKVLETMENAAEYVLDAVAECRAALEADTVTYRQNGGQK